MNTITKDEAKEILAKPANGQKDLFFTVCFVKRTTGEERIMNCRRGVKKYTNGVGMAYNPAKKGLIPVWEKRKDGSTGADCYRMIALENVLWINTNGQRFIVGGN